jgi:Raf kinase inhibitor-like YbhB/YbcL family protein
MELDVTSTAFEEGGAIPSRYTCDGLDVSPPLSWSSVPEDAQSLVLIADDPDAPGATFVHWVIYNLPPDTRRLPEDVPNRETLPSGAAQGVNGAGRVGYMGPCPPSGTHTDTSSRSMPLIQALTSEETQRNKRFRAPWRGTSSPKGV